MALFITHNDDKCCKQTMNDCFLFSKFIGFSLIKSLKARKQVQVTSITANEVLNEFYKNNIQRGIHLSLFSIDRLRHE